MACHLLILLANFAKAIDGVGAAADVLARVVRLGNQLMASKCNLDIGTMSLPGKLCGYNWGGIKPQQISNNSSAPLHRCEFAGSWDALEKVVSKLAVNLTHAQGNVNPAASLNLNALRQLSTLELRADFGYRLAIMLDSTQS